jgi:hypothetical protein
VAADRAGAHESAIGRAGKLVMAELLVNAASAIHPGTEDFLWAI